MTTAFFLHPSPPMGRPNLRRIAVALLLTAAVAFEVHADAWRRVPAPDVAKPVPAAVKADAPTAPSADTGDNGLAERAKTAALLCAAQQALPLTKAPAQQTPATTKGDDDDEQAAIARRGARLPEDIDSAIAVDAKGERIRSRRAVIVRELKAKAGDTLRAVAYRFCTSPRTLASLNDIRWQRDEIELEAGESIQVPVRFRSASGFGEGRRLESGPGVRVDRPHHSWGRPYVIATLTEAFRQVHQRWPGRHPFIVHDVSRFGGGRIGGHKSHRAGRDIDIGYPTREANREGWGNPRIDDIDYERLWFLVDHLERTGLTAAIYMSPRIQRALHDHAEGQGVPASRLRMLFQYPAAKGAKDTLIRHSPGHRDHLHIRFASPAELDELTS